MAAEVASSLGPTTIGPYANVPGLHSPATLTTHSGNFTTTADNQVIENLNITGRLVVNHVGVVARNCAARGVNCASSTNRSATLRGEWCSFGDAAGALDAYNGVGVRNYDLYRCEVYGCVDLIKITGGFAELRECWLRDPVQWLEDPQQGGAPSHTDIVQTALGADVSRIIIRDCRIDAWVFRQPAQAGDTTGDTTLSYACTGLISMFRQTTDFVINIVEIIGNRLDGNAYRWIYALHDAGEAATFATITDNLLIRRWSTFGREALLSVTTLSAITWGRNVDQFGTNVTAPGTTAAPTLPAAPGPIRATRAPRRHQWFPRRGNHRSVVPGPPPERPPSDEIEYRGRGSVATGVGPWTPGYPADLVAGDLLLLVVAHDLFTTIDQPAGWLPVGEPAGSPTITVFRRFYAGEGPPIVTGGGPATMSIHAWSGVHPSLPLDVAGAVNLTISGPPTGTSVLTASDGARLVLICSAGQDIADWAAPGAMTGRGDATTAPDHFLSDEPRPVAGPTGDRTPGGTFPGTGNTNTSAVLLALRPAPVPNPDIVLWLQRAARAARWWPRRGSAIAPPWPQAPPPPNPDLVLGLQRAARGARWWPRRGSASQPPWPQVPPVLVGTAARAARRPRWWPRRARLAVVVPPPVPAGHLPPPTVDLAVVTGLAGSIDHEVVTPQ